MLQSLALALLLSSSGCVMWTEANPLRFAMVSGGSSFFYPIENGWNAKCEELGVECQYLTDNTTGSGTWSDPNFNKTIDLNECVAQMRHFIEQKVDGLAVKCNYDHPIFQQARDAGIPVVGFAGYHPGPIDAYVGTDNVYLGRTMARLLRQLKPEGGTYITLHNGNSATERHEGFVAEIEKDNNRTDRALWSPHELDYPWYGRKIPFLGNSEADKISRMELLASHNPTAMLFMYQTPMRLPDYTDFIDRNRWRNITYLGTEGNGQELAYMARRYVDGLVGQLTYDMGNFAVETLYKMVTEGTDSVPKILNTKLVNYHLVPEELPPLEVDQSLLGNLKYVGLTCFGLVALCALACIAWSIYHRKSTVVRASQPFFLVMTAGGALLMSSALIPLSFDDGGNPISETRAIGVCMSIPWLSFLGFTIIFSALFAKTWRVNKFFHSSSSHGKIKVSEMDVLAPFAVLLTLNIIVLICWTLIDPLTYVRQFQDGTDLWNREIASHGSCRSDQPVAYLAPLALSKFPNPHSTIILNITPLTFDFSPVNCSVLVIACYQAFEARDIKSEFAEAKYIGLSIFSMCQGFLTGIPIVAVAKDIPEAFYLVLTFLIFIICMVILLLIFIPKILMQRRYTNMTAAEQRKAMAVSVRLSSGQELKPDSISGMSLPLSLNRADGGHNTGSVSAPFPGLTPIHDEASQKASPSNTPSSRETPSSQALTRHASGVTTADLEPCGLHVDRIDESVLPAKLSSYLSDEVVDA